MWQIGPTVVVACVATRMHLRTMGGAAADITDIRRHLFDLAAVQYRAQPSNTAFANLLTHRVPNDSHASLAEVVYEVARFAAFSAPSIGHLAKALSVDGRACEAEYFCSRWRALEPENVEAIGLLCCLRANAVTLRLHGVLSGAFRSLQHPMEYFGH